MGSCLPIRFTHVQQFFISLSFFKLRLSHNPLPLSSRNRRYCLYTSCSYDIRIQMKYFENTHSISNLKFIHNSKHSELILNQLYTKLTPTKEHSRSYRTSFSVPYIYIYIYIYIYDAHFPYQIHPMTHVH